MVDSKGGDTNTSKRQPQNPSKKPQNISSPSPSPKDEPSEKQTQAHTSPATTAGGAPVNLYVPVGIPTSSLPFEQQTPKRPRYTQWKTLPSPVAQHHQQQVSGLSPVAVTAPSTSDTASSGGQEQEKEAQAQAQAQYRKGKYVSPVWKPNEMLWLARAWKAQYQGGSALEDVGAMDVAVPPTRGKTRADKDREVAEFLNRHGIIRDAKTAGTKWDNMLGEFRKVYEWERGGERESVGKSYFRLSPYERKTHRLPASFDEDVFEELAQFMGARMRTPQQGRSGSVGFLSSDENRLVVAKALPPPLFRDEDLLISGPSSSTNPKEFRRIGKVRMIWEESVSLWAEEGEHHRGRVKLQGSNFLNADELIFLDESMVGSTMESFEDGPQKGFSVDRFVAGQQLKVFGRRKSYSTVSGSNERTHFHYLDQPSLRSISPVLEFQDPTEYYLGCLRGTPHTLPTLFELSWHLQEPPTDELRFPLRKDVYKDLPQGKELFFTTSSELLDCRAITFDLLSPIIRSSPSIFSPLAGSSRDLFIGFWDDCINRVVSKFCPVEMVLIRKPSSRSSENIQDQWPNVSGFVRNFCLWRGEETDLLREGHIDPSSSLVEKILWSYMDLPYILGYYAIGHMVTFCALSRSQDRITRTDLYTLDLSNPHERLKALVPCWRIASLLPLLADKCSSFTNTVTSNIMKQFPFSDFEMISSGKGDIIEMTPNYITKFYSIKRKWVAAKEIYDYLDRRIPHAEYIFRSSEDDMAITFKPRGVRLKPQNVNELVEALKHVTKSLVALHDISFMHRDLRWEKVMRRVDREGEWFITGFEEAVGAPQLNPHALSTEARGYQAFDKGKEQTKAKVDHTSGVREALGGTMAPEMGRGLHGVKVDVWGVGQLVMTWGVARVPEMLRELAGRCLEGNPELRPTAADCYHHLLQLQSLMAGGSGY